MERELKNAFIKSSMNRSWQKKGNTHGIHTLTWSHLNAHSSLGVFLFHVDWTNNRWLRRQPVEGQHIQIQGHTPPLLHQKCKWKRAGFAPGASFPRISSHTVMDWSWPGCFCSSLIRVLLWSLITNSFKTRSSFKASKMNANTTRFEVFFNWCINSRSACFWKFIDLQMSQRNPLYDYS